jgi:hypothetical protein
MHDLFDVCVTPMIANILEAIMLLNGDLQPTGLCAMISCAQLQTLVPMCMIDHCESGGQATFGVHRGQLRDMWTYINGLHFYPAAPSA